MEIITSHWKEDLGWLSKTHFKVNVIDKVGSAYQRYFKPMCVIPNKGSEASVYLKFIIERYDSLPSHVCFLHGHENAWHHYHDRPLLDIIESADVSRFDFIPLNNIVRKFNFSYNQFEIPETFHVLKLGDLPGDRNVNVCAQFIVSKKNILLHTVDQYKYWYMMTQCDELTSVGFLFEYAWDIIFKGDQDPQNYFTVATRPPIDFTKAEFKDEWMTRIPGKTVEIFNCIDGIEDLKPDVVKFNLYTNDLELLKEMKPYILKYKPIVIVRSTSAHRNILTELGYNIGRISWKKDMHCLCVPK